MSDKLCEDDCAQCGQHYPKRLLEWWRDRCYTFESQRDAALRDAEVLRPAEVDAWETGFKAGALAAGADWDPAEMYRRYDAWIENA